MVAIGIGLSPVFLRPSLGGGSPPLPDSLLLANGTDRLLLADGVSFLLLS